MPGRRDRALLLDLDGVLRRWPTDLATRAERAAGLPLGSIHAAAFEPGLLRRAITGAIDDATWRSEAALRIARDHPHGSAKQALVAWSAAVGEVDAEVRALVAQARERARVVLVTNATTRLGNDLRALGLSDALDDVVNSSVVGHAKPDERIFRAALERAAIPRERALFVDDAPANVAAAQALGIVGHLFRDPAGLAEALASHGLLQRRSGPPA
jgi:putative hydrolase of the HAD superfamily